MRIERGRGRRRIAEETLGVPTGWYAAALSHELTRNGVLPLRCFERDLVAFRGEDGLARVLDARCPHLGAHIGHGGRVIENRVQCPFHGWCFDGEGTCVEVPYSPRIPSLAKLDAWHTREQNGAVMVWYDEGGAPPAWEPPSLEETESPSWLAQDRRSFTIRAPVQDLAENAVDRAHFPHLHGLGDLPAMRAETEGHRLRVFSQVRYPAHLGGAEGTLTSTSWGLGISAVRFSGVIQTFLLLLSTPIERDLVVVRIAPYLHQVGDADLQATIGRIFLGEVEAQFEADIRIWENKVTLRSPLLCEGDGPIGLFRRWARQFYADAAAM